MNWESKKINIKGRSACWVDFQSCIYSSSTSPWCYPTWIRPVKTGSK